MKKTVKILAILLIAAGVLCGGIALWKYCSEQNAGKEYDTLREEAVKAELSEPEPSEVSEPEPVCEIAEPEPEPAECPIDFVMLQEENPDIYAWIQVPGTRIDYPILCREGDGEYYLDHSYTGKKKKEGAIFTEDLNSRDFTDPNTVIYGHNMKNGSMFKDLHQYRDRKFFEEHPDVIIYTPEKMLQYQVFAAYVYDDRHILKNFDFSDPNVLGTYTEKILDRSRNMSDNIDNNVVLTAESRLITLSTCTGNAAKRYLVQAVLTDSRPVK